MTQPYLSIILPVYNEEARLERCLERLTSYYYNYTHFPFEIVVALNGCQDGSTKIAFLYAAKWPQITIRSLPWKGKGLAIREGMLKASGKFRLMVDVDLATPPNQYHKFLNEAVDGAALVAGVRAIEYRNPLRWMAHVGYKLMARPLTWCHDPQCGFKLFSEACARHVFTRLKTTGWGFDVEALHIAEKGGFQITEVLVPWENDESGSKLRVIRDGLRMFQDLQRIRRIYSQHATSQP